MTFTVKMSTKGQLVIPAAIRHQLCLDPQSEFTVSVHKGKIVLNPLPTADDWAELFKDTPVEQVDLDESGHYDPQKSPEFHKWMEEG